MFSPAPRRNSSYPRETARVRSKPAHSEKELAAAKQVGRNAVGVQGDVANLSDLDRMFAQIGGKKGSNARTAQLAPLGNISEEHYDDGLQR
jgi:hypothetical protein